MKVDFVIEETNNAIQEGKCVVIGLQNTGEVCMATLQAYYTFTIEKN